MSKSIGKFAVDSGTFMLIDPCYLFTTAEWREIMKKSGPDHENYREAVIEAICRRSKLDPKHMQAVIVDGFGGDGVFEVRRTDMGIEVDL